MPRGRNADVDDDDFVAALEEWPQGEVYPSTSTIKDEIEEEHNVEYDRKTVYRRLDSLESEGRISKFEVGRGRGKSVGWYVAGAKPGQETVNTSGGVQTGHRREPEQYEEPDPPEQDSKASRGGMDLPVVMLFILFGWAAGWTIYKAVVLQRRGRERIFGDDGLVDTGGGALSVDKGVLMIFGGAVGAFASLGLLSYMALQAADLVSRGFVGAAIGYACGVAVVIAMLYRFGHRAAERQVADSTSDTGEIA